MSGTTSVLLSFVCQPKVRRDCAFFDDNKSSLKFAQIFRLVLVRLIVGSDSSFVVTDSNRNKNRTNDPACGRSLTMEIVGMVLDSLSRSMSSVHLSVQGTVKSNRGHTQSLSQSLSIAMRLNHLFPIAKHFYTHQHLHTLSPLALCSPALPLESSMLACIVRDDSSPQRTLQRSPLLAIKSLPMSTVEVST